MALHSLGNGRQTQQSKCDHSKQPYFHRLSRVVWKIFGLIWSRDVTRWGIKQNRLCFQCRVELMHTLETSSYFALRYFCCLSVGCFSYQMSVWHFLQVRCSFNRKWKKLVRMTPNPAYWGLACKFILCFSTDYNLLPSNHQSVDVLTSE